MTPISPRRPTKRAARPDRPRPDAPPADALLAPLPALQPYERPYDPDAPSPEPGLGLQRAIHRAFGIEDSVEIEVRVLTTTLPGDSQRMAESLRDDARSGLSKRATPADVDAEAIRILHEMAGLVPPRWGPYPPDVAAQMIEPSEGRAAEPPASWPDQRPDGGHMTSDAPSGEARPQRTRRRRPKGAE